MKRSLGLLIGTAAATIALTGSITAGQDATGPALPPSPPEPVVLDDGFEAVKAALIGTWKAASGEYDADADQTGGTLWMSVAPITVRGLTNTLYIERAWDTAKHHPFGQGVLQLYRFEGKIRMRSLEFRGGMARSNIFTGLWAAPEVMPPLAVNELIATLDFEVSLSAAGFVARTPYPYPTALGGACQLISEFSITGDKITSLDKGIATDGSTAWSSNEGAGYAWERADMGLQVRKDEDGFIMIEYAGWDSPEATLGDQAFIDHIGQTQNGMVFMSSAMSGTLAQLTLPVTEMPYEGLLRTLEDMRIGSIRRTIVPPAIGFGDVEVSGVPANSTLYFMIDCISYEKGEVRDEPDAPADPAAEAAEGGGGGGL